MMTRDGRMTVIAGRSRSGKTAWTVKQVTAHKRVCAWDPEDQWSKLPGWQRVTTKRQLRDALMTQKGPLKLAYVVRGELKGPFDFWAALVLEASIKIAPLAVVGEELADVTTPSKAPGNWGTLLRRGLKRGIDFYCISQRWAEADKTAVSNASRYACFAMRPRDVRYMAKEIGADPEKLAGLVPQYWDVQQTRAKMLPYLVIESDGRESPGKMTFPKPKS